MPYRRKYFRRRRGRYPYRKRRRFFRRRYGRANLPSTRLRPTGPPRRMVVKMRYHDTQQLTPAAGTMVQHVYSLNSIYDPNVTGVGGQPMSSDQWAGLYNRYVVIGARAVMRWAPDGTASTAAQLVGYHLSEGASGITTTEFTRAMEQPSTRYRILKGISGGDPQILSTKISTRKFLSIKNPTDDESVVANWGANPTANIHLTCFAYPADNTTYATVTLNIDITYIVLCLDPVVMTTS